jgi:ribosomal protein L7/L12
MKLDKMQFAEVLICVANMVQKQNVDSIDIKLLDDLIDIEIPTPTNVYPTSDDINNLMMLMAGGTQKIEAIKVHRKLTGWGLKESKDAVEKYWINTKPNSYTWNELKNKIDDKFNTDEVTAIMRFLDQL